MAHFPRQTVGILMSEYVLANVFLATGTQKRSRMHSSARCQLGNTRLTFSAWHLNACAQTLDHGHHKKGPEIKIPIRPIMLAHLVPSLVLHAKGPCCENKVKCFNPCTTTYVVICGN